MRNIYLKFKYLFVFTVILLISSCAVSPTDDVLGINGPSAFNIISPETDIIDAGLTPTFKWTESTDVDPKDVVTYNLYLGSLADSVKLGSLPLYKSGIMETSYTVENNLTTSLKYYWRIEATDGVALNNRVSETRSFIGKISKVLIINDFKDNVNTTALKTALDENYEVYISDLIESEWDSNSVNLDTIDGIIHLNGTRYDLAPEMPTTSQTAIVDFVKNGGIYVGLGLSTYDFNQGRMKEMEDLILFDIENADNFNGLILDYLVIDAQVDHPVLFDVEDIENVQAFSFTDATLRNFTDSPSVLIMNDKDGISLVATRELGEGKVVVFNNSGNYSDKDVLSVQAIQAIIDNALRWND